MGDRLPHSVYEFGDFQLDPVQRVLRSRVDGRVVPLTSRVFDTLLYLVEHPGQVLGKSQLVAAIWPHVVVEEANLTQAVYELRRALNEHPGEHRFVVTVPGRGYSFVADVVARERRSDQLGGAEQLREVESEPTTVAIDAAAMRIAPSAGQRSSDAERASPVASVVFSRWIAAGPNRQAVWVLLAVLMIAVGAYAVWQGVGTRDRNRSLELVDERAPQASIAVLAFTDLSPGGDQQYFSDGLSEELMHLLAQTPSLRVIARTSSFSFKDRNVDFSTIARRLGVTHVLEGSVRPVGNRLRITVQLIDAATSSHVWSQTYDREPDEIFAVQNEIAASVASVLKTTLTSANARAIAAAVIDARAYDAFLRARFFYYRRQAGDIRRAEEAYRRALDNDPTFARAWAGLSSVYLIEASGETNELGLSPDVAPKRARDAAERALMLDPNLAEAHVRVANYHTQTGDPAASRDHLQRAAALEPDNPLVLANLAGVAIRDGRIDDAVELMSRTVARDPLAPTFRAHLGVFLFWAGKFERARSELSMTLELIGSSVAASGQSAVVAHDVAQTLIAEDRLGEALTRVQSWPDGVYREHALALIHRARGNRREADVALQRLIAIAEPHMVAETYAYRSETDEAFRWLAKATERSRQRHEFYQPWRLDIRYSPFARSLHGDPRWKAWLAEAS